MVVKFDIPEENRRQWITVVGGEFYPDYLDEARVIYGPVFIRFNELLDESATSEDLFRRIAREPGNKMVQLTRIFRKYVSPDTSVEMLKRRTRAEQIIKDFGNSFRPIDQVKERFKSRPLQDDVLFAIMYEQKDRGKKGYELTRVFFEWFENTFGSTFSIDGPRGAGRDIYLSSVLSDYPYSTPVDFVIKDEQDVLQVIGFARYDTDRGGSQEDDRTSGYGEKVVQILQYSASRNLNIKVLYINDGPGLLLGSMCVNGGAIMYRKGGEIKAAMAV